ncbi:uncharacterized protein [Arachis hypogaea]|uniref:uncharacterized protein isoform X2 n=1 Tax=Arachis hypogaea TaxID=3818 RepID=UPI000DECE86F|nr:uncharacterized protein LOC112710909 isoform X2 [Arachis hypogaea]
MATSGGAQQRLGTNVLSVLALSLSLALFRHSRRLSFGESPRGSVAKPLARTLFCHTGSDSKCSSSCARKRWRGSPITFPPAAVNELEWSAGSYGSSSRGPSHECSPKAKSVVSTVSGLQSDLRQLSDAISQHDVVVSEIRDAIQLLMDSRSRRRLWCQLEGIARVADVIDTTPAPRSPTRGRRRNRLSKAVVEANHPKQPSHCGVLSWIPPSPSTTSLSSPRGQKWLWRNLTHLLMRPDPSVSRRWLILPPTTRRRRSHWQIHANHEFETGVPSSRQRSDLHSKEPAAVVNIGKVVSMTVQGIPKSMNLVFRPTDDMNLSGVELVVATYIFMRHLPERHWGLLCHSGSAHDSGTEDGGCGRCEHQFLNSLPSPVTSPLSQILPIFH